MSSWDRVFASSAALKEAVVTTFASATPRTAPLPVPRAEESPDPFQALALWLERPTSTSIVVRLAGELDATTAPRLHELLAPQLSSAAEILVLDMSELSFLGVAGLELVGHAQRHAVSRGKVLCLVDGPVCVDRALKAAGWSTTIPRYRSVAAAVTELSELPRALAR